MCAAPCRAASFCTVALCHICIINSIWAHFQISICMSFFIWPFLRTFSSAFSRKFIIYICLRMEIANNLLHLNILFFIQTAHFNVFSCIRVAFFSRTQVKIYEIKKCTINKLFCFFFSPVDVLVVVVVVAVFVSKTFSYGICGDIFCLNISIILAKYMIWETSSYECKSIWQINFWLFLSVFIATWNSMAKESTTIIFTQRFFSPPPPFSNALKQESAHKINVASTFAAQRKLPAIWIIDVYFKSFGNLVRVYCSHVLQQIMIA